VERRRDEELVKRVLKREKVGLLSFERGRKKSKRERLAFFSWGGSRRLPLIQEKT